jgi:hypothetical protein
MRLHHTSAPSEPRHRGRKLVISLLLAAAAAGSGACAGDDGPAPANDAGDDQGGGACALACAEGPGTIVIGNGVVDPGSGLVTYEPLSDGQDVLVVPGWQGGQHIWVILRAEDVATGCFFSPRYRLLDGDEVVEQRFYGGEFYELPGEDGLLEFPAFAFQVESEDVHRRELELVVDGADACGNMLTASVAVVPYDTRLDDPVGGDAGRDMGRDLSGETGDR